MSEKCIFPHLDPFAFENPSCSLNTSLLLPPKKGNERHRDGEKVRGGREVSLAECHSHVQRATYIASELRSFEMPPAVFAVRLDPSAFTFDPGRHAQLGNQ